MVKERFADRVPPGAFDDYDAVEDKIEHRRALAPDLSDGTKRNYRCRFNHYQRWCATHHYQPDAAFISDARAEEYVADQTGPGIRFHPETIQQSLSALRYYAERAGVDPVPSLRAAHDRLRTYRRKAAAVEAART